MATVLELAERLGIPCREADIDLYDAYNADEVFLTSTSLCMCGVRTINGVTIADGTIPGPTSEGTASPLSFSLHCRVVLGSESQVVSTDTVRVKATHV